MALHVLQPAQSLFQLAFHFSLRLNEVLKKKKKKKKKKMILSSANYGAKISVSCQARPMTFGQGSENFLVIAVRELIL